MAHHKSALKRIRQTERRNERNTARKTRCRTSIKKVLAAVEEKNLEAAEKELRLAMKLLDRIAVRGTIHVNKAARDKSRLSRMVATLRAGAEQTKPAN